MVFHLLFQMSGPPAPFHGHFRRGAGKTLFVSITGAILSGLAWKYGVSEPRKKRYADFYKTYDPLKDEERMIAAGVFDEINSGWRSRER